MNPIFLGVNISQVAALRNTHSDASPDPVIAAAAAEIGGADIITAHLREDRLYLTDRDVRILRETLKTRLNLMIAPTDDLISVALALAPHTVTMVPKTDTADYSGYAFDDLSSIQDPEKTLARLKAAGSLCSVFIEPKTDLIDAVKKLGFSGVELNCGHYALTPNLAEQEKQLKILSEAAAYAHSLDLGVSAGQGLDYSNVARVAAIPHISGLNIGHSIIARSVFTGLKEAVETMRSLMIQAR